MRHHCPWCGRFIPADQDLCLRPCAEEWLDEILAAYSDEREEEE